MFSRLSRRGLLALGLSLTAAPVLAQDLDDVALILPLKGRLASAATVVRDGFLAAYYQDLAQHKPTPVLRIYDNGDGHGVKLVHNAAFDGAQAVVGPLNKDQVAELEAAGTPPVPVLALNRAEGSAPNLYQYALAPEEELASLVATMRRQGITHVQEILQDDAGSERNRVAFEAAWRQAGGNVAAPLLLDPSEKSGISKGIRQFLNGGGAQGIDAVFVASPQLTTQIKPSLNYYGAAQLPVYTLATAYDGNQNDTQRLDLNGVRFCDQPWIVQGGWPEQDGLYAALGHPASNFDRLYAFGGDAYQLLSAIYAHPDDVQLNGRSGRLTLGQDQRVHRDLNCVEIRDGHAQALAAPGGVAPTAAGT